MKPKSVAILESRLADRLADLVTKRGWHPLSAPALAEVPDVDSGAIGKLLTEFEADPPHVAVFQTGVGAQAFFEAADALGATARLLALLDKCLVVARGPKPTAVLRSRKVRIDRGAKEPFTTREVLQALSDVSLRGKRVVVQRYGETNEGLDRALLDRGARVVEVPTYRWALPENIAPMQRLFDALERCQVDATVFTSAAQVRNLFLLADRLGKPALATHLNRTLVASIGPVCSAALRERGVNISLEASPPKLGTLVSALDSALSQ